MLSQKLCGSMCHASTIFCMKIFWAARARLYEQQRLSDSQPSSASRPPRLSNRSLTAVCYPGLVANP